MTITSPKTEHHQGKGMRVVPLFAELRPYLEDVMTVGAEFVLGGLRCDSNRRTRFEKIIKRAGATPWPRLWHNLRASRQTELEERFPSHVV